MQKNRLIVCLMFLGVLSMDTAAYTGDQEILTLENFNKIKNFILQHGDRETYCNMLNDNPHFQFADLDAYLHPEGGRKNINCDPNLSDFDELVIWDRNRAGGELYSRIAVKPGFCR